ncbi:MAG TPA: aspartyl protease family protein [Candidatus Elarobacter sp.]
MRIRAARLFSVVAALALAAVLPAAARSAEPAPSVSAVLAASRAALGLDALPRLRTVRFRGPFVVVGVKGQADSWTDVRDGRFAQTIDAGPLSGAQGYDGAHAWNRDASGLVWNDDGAAGRYGALEQVYQNTFALWQPGYGGAAVTASSAVDGGRSYDVLKVKPRQTPAFDMWFDRGSHLPVRVVATIGVMTNTTRLADYRPVGGVKFPYSIASDTNGNTAELTVTSAAANDPGAEVALQRPLSHVDDFSVAGGATTIPFELVDNHVAIPVTINGKGPYRFLFDTGGANLIDTALAKELGLGGVGNAQGSGVGAATEGFAIGVADRVQIGGATLRKQVFSVAPVRAGFGMSSGKPVDGLVGFEVLSRFVTTFDYGKNEIVLRSPGSALPTTGTTIPFVFDGEHVQIPCAIDSFTGACTVDTGSRVSLSVYSPFLAAHPAIVPPNAAAPGANGFGIGGAALGRLGRTTLQIAGYTIPDLVTDLSTQTKGAFADPYGAGNIGAGALKRFALTFDYAKHVVNFTPDAHFAARDEYDRSGAFLITQNGAIVVADVRPGTPAAAAGLAKGDRITAAGGRDAASLGLGGLRSLFLGTPGTAIPLTVTNRDGAVRSLTITLRDYV